MPSRPDYRYLLTAPALLLVAASERPESLRIGVIGELNGAHPDLSAAAGPIGELALRGLTYFNGVIEIACLLCDALPTEADKTLVDAPAPDGAAGQTVRFRLKSGLRWDDGRPVTAQDAVLAWQVGRAADSAYFWRSRLQHEIVSVRAVGRRLVEVHRRGRACNPADFRFALLPSQLETDVAQGNVAGYALKSLHVVTPTKRGLYNGPYRVTAYRAGPPGNQSVAFAQNPYWSGKRPIHRRIELIYRPNAAAMAKALVAGEVDLLLNAPLTVADAIEKDSPDRFAVVRREGRVLMQVSLNHEDVRLADVRVRRALLQALDRNALASSFGPWTIPARSFLTRRFPFFEAAASADGDAAVLLEAAGWRLGSDGIRRDSRGQVLSFRMAVATTHADRPFVQEAIAAWRRAGVEVTPERFGGIAQLTGNDPPPLALFPYQLEGGRNVDFHIFGSGAIPKPGEVRNGLNIFRYRNPATDRIVEDLREGCDPMALAGHYKALQRQVAEDLPLLPLFFLPEAHLLPSRLVPPDNTRIAYLLLGEIENWKWRSDASERRSR